jgi:cellulose synthase/poly-beta-1,6-N-acetylglucosamine synthase-like glycosyltransferase
VDGQVLIVLDAAVGVVAVALVVPAATLLVQTLSAVLLVKPPMAAGPSRRPSVAVLVPAHNEEDLIGTTIASIRPQLADGDRVVVIADNCTDQTAAIATSLDVCVVERFDPRRPGKGYALDHGIRYLAKQPPEVVVVVDADCHVHSESLEILARQCAAVGRPIQAQYLMFEQPKANLSRRFAEFAWAVKNLVRPLGMSALGGPCQLMGSGMALPWELASEAPMGSGSLVEDLELGLALARRGRAPLFSTDARITSPFPHRANARRAQNTRWDHGHLTTLVRDGPTLMVSAIRKRDLQLTALVLDLCVPPLSLLLLGLVAVGLAAVVLANTGAPAWPAFVALAGVSMMAVSVGASWLGFGRKSVSLFEMLLAPFYAISKLPIYMRLLFARQTEWIRTDRDK